MHWNDLFELTTAPNIWCRWGGVDAQVVTWCVLRRLTEVGSSVGDAVATTAGSKYRKRCSTPSSAV